MSAPNEAELQEIYNYLRLSDRIATSGKPTLPQIDAIAAAGFEAVVSLLPDDQALPGEEERLDELGLDYTVIPVVWMNPRPRDFERFVDEMARRAGQRVYVHCAANMRVSAFFYLLRVTSGSHTEEAARADMAKIWTPNEVWQAFLDRMQSAT